MLVPCVKVTTLFWKYASLVYGTNNWLGGCIGAAGALKFAGMVKLNPLRSGHSKTLRLPD
jgi:hypothetical protein